MRRLGILLNLTLNKMTHEEQIKVNAMYNWLQSKDDGTARKSKNVKYTAYTALASVFPQMEDRLRLAAAMKYQELTSKYNVG